MKIRKELFQINNICEKENKYARVYLQCPHLDVKKKRVVATNGHIMIVIPVETEKGDRSGRLPRDMLLAAKAVAKEEDASIACQETMTISPGPITYPRRSSDENKFKAKIDKAIPSKDGRIEINFNPRYLLEIAKVINSKMPRAQEQGVRLFIDPKDKSAPILVESYDQLDEDPFGILMPMRM